MKTNALGILALPLKETPPYENYHDQTNGSKWPVLGGVSVLPLPRQKGATHLFKQQFPIDSDSRLLVLPAIFPEPSGHLSHPLKTVASVQEVFNVLRHDFGDVS